MPSFRVPEMSCGHCKAAIEKAVGELDDAAEVVVDVAAKTVVFESRATEAKLRAAIERAGYEAYPLG